MKLFFNPNPHGSSIPSTGNQANTIGKSNSPYWWIRTVLLIATSMALVTLANYHQDTVWIAEPVHHSGSTSENIVHHEWKAPGNGTEKIAILKLREGYGKTLSGSTRIAQAERSVPRANELTHAQSGANVPQRKLSTGGVSTSGFKPVTIFLTSYNPSVNQTDATPCVAGGTGVNLCDMAKQGIRTIALSQELTAWSKYASANSIKAGTKVRITSTDQPNDWRCNGILEVSDAMNARYRKRGDLFFMNRKDNVSCTVLLEPIYENNV